MMKSLSLVLFVLLQGGCLDTIWKQYERPNYGPSRAEQVCHPYGDCSQGRWVATPQAEGDVTHAYWSCRDQFRQPTNGWSKSSVSVGLEIGRCMQSTGYELVPVNN